ncbi:uncharacterized protein A4U43_C03F8730 [Asparagus officinalis]|uniref:RNase H type-1 domain-containing protein n=1 Tax=Asparagus officinalis TaxID=4686 RepID=A0A5P1FDG9_ASPOF|nr:uncharacterized protein A4U43_C03F8730 [Asparagus officinalis]
MKYWQWRRICAGRVPESIGYAVEIITQVFSMLVTLNDREKDIKKEDGEWCHSALEEPHVSVIASAVPEVWRAPCIGIWKVNFDGAVFLEKRAMGVGLIVRNLEGGFYAIMSKLIRIRGNNAQHVEIQAAWEVVKFARGTRFWKVVFEGDAEAIIRDIHNSLEQHSSLRAYHG